MFYQNLLQSAHPLRVEQLTVADNAAQEGFYFPTFPTGSRSTNTLGLYSTTLTKIITMAIAIIILIIIIKFI